MKHLTLLCILLPLLMSGCQLIPEDEEAIAPPLKKPPEVKFVTQIVKKGSIEDKIETIAKFVSTKQYNLCFKGQGGRLMSVCFAAGDKVKKGDLIAELYSDDVKERLDEQDIAIHRLEVENKHKEVSLKRNIELSGQKLDKLKSKYEVMKQLSDAYSRDEMDNMQNSVAEAEVEYKNLTDSFSSMHEQGEMDMKLLKMQHVKLAEEFDRVRIISPTDGEIVFLNYAKAGDNVNADETFATVASSSELQLEYEGGDFSRFKTGVDITVEFNEAHYKGKVAMTPSDAPKDTDASWASAVYIKVDNLPEGARIGDSANIKLLIRKKDDVIVIKKSTVHGYKGLNYVYILEQGIRKEREVNIGIETPDEVEIISGLDAGDELIQ